jgi:hypothetical protein
MGCGAIGWMDSGKIPTQDFNKISRVVQKLVRGTQTQGHQHILLHKIRKEVYKSKVPQSNDCVFVYAKLRSWHSIYTEFWLTYLSELPFCV